MKILDRYLLMGLFLFLSTNISHAQSDHLYIRDTRNDATLPGHYNQAIMPSFKFSHVMGVDDPSMYATVMGLRGWVDDSGGPAHELAFTGRTGILYRTGTQANGWSNWRKILSENANGHVGIGTNSPAEKLSVNGKVRAHEIKVEVTGWPDYVFEPNYRLQSLQDLNRYIKTHGHLPEIPKATNIEADGLSLGEMNKLLLKKIEELSLHLIEKDEQVQSLESRLQIIEKHLSTSKP